MAVIAVFCAVLFYFWGNADGPRCVRSGAGSRWLRGRQRPTVVRAERAEHGPDARSRDLGGEHNNESRIFHPRSPGEDAGVAVQNDGRMSVNGMKSSAATDHPPTFTESPACCAPPNRGTDTGEWPGGRGESVATEDHEHHKSEISPLVKVPRFSRCSPSGI